MNDAYTTPPTQADAKLLAEFNAGVQRARDEYRQHPLAFGYDTRCAEPCCNRSRTSKGMFCAMHVPLEVSAKRAEMQKAYRERKAAS